MSKATKLFKQKSVFIEQNFSIFFNKNIAMSENIFIVAYRLDVEIVQ